MDEKKNTAETRSKEVKVAKKPKSKKTDRSWRGKYERPVKSVK